MVAGRIYQQEIKQARPQAHSLQQPSGRFAATSTVGDMRLEPARLTRDATQVGERDMRWHLERGRCASCGAPLPEVRLWSGAGHVGARRSQSGMSRPAQGSLAGGEASLEGG